MSTLVQAEIRPATHVTDWVDRALVAALAITIVLLSGGHLNESLRIGGDTGRGANQLLIVPIFAVCALLVLYRARRSFILLSASPLTIALVTVPLLSVLWSTDPSQTLSRSLALLFAVCASLFLAERCTPRELMMLVAIGVGTAALLNMLYVLLTPGTGLMHDGHAGAWRGLYSQKNGLARLMVLGTVACFYAAAVSRRHRRLLALVGSGLCLTLTFLSTSMTAVVALLAVGVAVALVHMLRARGPALVVSTGIVATMVTCLLLLLALYAEESAALLGRDLTLTGRTVIWTTALSELQDRPYLGFGYGAFWTGWSGPAAIVWAQSGFDPGDSHNGFLDAAIDLGILGALLFLVHLSVTVWAAIRWSRLEGATTWPVAFLAVFVIYNLTESSVLRPTNLLWILYLAVSLRLALDLRRASTPQLAS